LVKKKKRTTCGQMARQAQMSDPARGNSERAAGAAHARPRPRPSDQVAFSFSPFLLCGSQRHIIVFKPGHEATHTHERLLRFSVSVFTLQLITGVLRHHSTHRFFLLKLHSLLFISPQTARLESPQAARILPRMSAVPSR
jgi:hypothetical protein